MSTNHDLEDLQSELIIPRSPSPPPNPSTSRGRNNLPVDRRARLASLKVYYHVPAEGKTDFSQREIEQIKAEDRDDLPAPRGQKHGADPELISGRAYKTSRTSTGTVVVDLTDD